MSRETDPHRSASDGPGGEASWIQRLLWAGQALHPQDPLYNMALAFELSGTLEIRHFEAAVRSVIARADAMRTVFEASGEALTRHVMEHLDWDLAVHDLTQASDPDEEARLWMTERTRRGFELGGPLFDMALLRLEPGRHVWYVNQHHLITDGWAVAVLYSEVQRAFELSRSGRLNEAPPLPSFDEHVEAERSIRGTRAHEKAVEHWRGQLAGLEPVLLYGKREPRQSTASERLTVSLGPDRSSALRLLADRPEARGLTTHLSQLNVVAAFVFAFLHRVSGERRLAVATPAHNRRSERDKSTLGVFIEMFPLVIEIDGDVTFSEVMRQTGRASSGFVRYALPGASQPHVNRSCNVVLNYINASFPSFADLEMQSEWLHPGHADLAHDIRVQVHDFDDAGSFVLHFDLSTERFNEAEREAVVRHFLTLMDSFLADPDQPLHAPPIADAAERTRLLSAARGGHEARSDEDAASTVVERIAAQMARTPDDPAVGCEDVVWSYAELDQHADRVARVLADQDLGGRPVAISAIREPETIAGILGVLRAGAAFMPLDLTHPADRVRFLIEESGATVLLARRGEESRIAGLGIEPLWLEDLLEPGDDEPPVARGSAEVGPTRDDLAYVLYTSGSTGRPKGVMVTHGSLDAYADWAAKTYWESQPLAAPLFTPLTFDLTITSIFAPLLVGGTIYTYPLADEGVDVALLRVLEEDRVDVVKLTPAHLSLLRGRDLSNSRVRVLIVGGAELRRDVALDAWEALGKRVTIYNEYGPTEATVGCMIHRFDPDAPGVSVPIGRAAGTARIYLVDEALRPVPDGIVGEIVVGGTGVARGYLGRSEETAERFVEDPGSPGDTAYRTGDLGRTGPDGALEFLGRNDRQVKLHGIRIEPAEIEGAISSLPGVSACVVDFKDTSSDRLEIRCVRCGLDSTYPAVEVDASGICSVCRSFDKYEEQALAYFQSMTQLESLLASRPGPGDFDCIMMYSGGKDSTYALYRLSEMGLRILTLTLDNGFISEEAKQNIARVVESLGVAHESLTTPAMNEVFADSLERHSNVCNGCFKVMYTLATNVAIERDIPFVVTGLSRGQFFETRLTEELFLGDRYEGDEIDTIVLDARRAYHRVDDAVRRCLDTSAFDDDGVFDRVQFVDFYRYCDVALDDVYAFLQARAPWVRPADTGRSTNCLINDVGIYVHKRERGFHNYAWPYSWDVRLGHKQRDVALEELDDDIDEARVQEILTEIGYEPRPSVGTPDGGRLVAYVVGDSELDLLEIRVALASRLPSYMIPSDILRIEEIPLTANGKVDHGALPKPLLERTGSEAEYVEPRSDQEKWFADTWERVLQTDRVGVHDNFFDLGGDSIAVIQIAAQASAAGFELEPNLVFKYPTIADLVTHAVTPDGAGTSPLEDPDRDWSGDLDDTARTKVLAQLRRAETRTDREDPSHSGEPV